MIGVFGDTTTFEYDFSTKVGGSSAECPLKIFQSSINLSKIPTPTVQATNAVLNGNFINGINNWNTISINLTSTSGNICRYTATAQYGAIQQNLASYANYKNHKLYFCAYVKTNSNNNCLLLNDGVSQTTVSHIGDGTFKLLSGIRTIDANATRVYVRVQDGRASGWTETQCYGFVIVDLTAIFGSGNEPDISVCDSAFGTWFDGTKAIYAYWNEVVSQNYIDKLKIQNEIPITSTNTSARTAIYNGKTLVQQSTSQPAIRDDFVGKVSASTVANPNIEKRGAYTSLVNPSIFNYEEPAYSTISALDGTTQNMSTSTNLLIPQMLFSFNIIEMAIRKYGNTIGTTLAEQVAWCKANIASITANWYGYGLSPLGNKANFVVFRAFDNVYSGSVLSNTSSSPTVLSYGISAISNIIDSNGFTHFLAYTDQARTTDSTLLVLTNHGLTGTDNLIENTTRNTVVVVNNVSSGTANTIVTPSITGQSSGDSIKKFARVGGTFVAGTGTNSTTLVISNHGLSTGDYIRNGSVGNVISKVTVVDANTLTCNTAITSQASGNSIALYHYIGTQTAESTVIPSTIYTDYISIDVQFKTPYGYDILVPQNPRRDSITNGNYDNVVLLEKIWNPITTDFNGKVSGSTVENGNIAKATVNNVLQAPNGTWATSDYNQNDYGFISSLNGSIRSASGSANGNIAQQLFAFDLIKAFEKVNGTIQASDKVGWLKGVLNTLTCNWNGYGSNPSGNKAILELFRVDANSYTGSTASFNTSNNVSPIIRATTSIFQVLDSNGMVYFLAYTDASNGTINSVINTDYVKLDLTFKNGNNALEFFTNNSVELQTSTNGLASAYMIELDLTPICNGVFGGSNSALKSAMKSINVDVWAQGSGASGGVLANGVTVQSWYNSGSKWDNTLGLTYNTSSSSTIAKISNTDTRVPQTGNTITSSNKLYILVASQYTSDGTIPSQVSLDYINIKVDFARTPDTVSPISINLPQSFALVGSISPSWDNTAINKKIFQISNSDSTNSILFHIHADAKFRLTSYLNGVANYVFPSTITFSKNQVIKFMLCVTASTLYLYFLTNNGTVQKFTNINTGVINGLQKLWIGQSYYFDQVSDAFFEKITLLDLINNPNGLDDSTVTAILNGTASGWENPELFDINKVALHANAIRKDGVIYLNATASYQGSTLTIPVLPNNQYELKINMTGYVDTNKRPYVCMAENYNNITIKYDYVMPTSNPNNSSFIFTTNAKTNNIIVYLQNTASGVFTFSDISLKRKD
jgi:hypothetical protein